MLRFLFRLIPWWLYAVIGLSLVTTTIPLYEEYRRDQAEQDLALTVGSPVAIPVSRFRGPGVTPLDEVHLTGVIRADLGINELPSDTTSRTFVVIGPQGGGGPLVALITTTAQSERMLDALLANVGTNGAVTVQGLLTTSGQSGVRTELARQGENGTVYLVEPFLNGRAAALKGKTQDSMIGVAIAAGFSAVALLAAFFKFRAWRNRSAMRRYGRNKPVPATHPTQTQQASTSTEVKSPWGAPAPAPTAKPQTIPPQAASLTAAADEPAVTPPEPEFKSVFPGGGSSFRFKTSEQIIRQSFGTFRTRKQLATRSDTTNDAT